MTRELRPRVIVVENVQAFLTRQVRHPKTNLPTSAARWLIDDLAEDYAVFPFLLTCATTEYRGPASQPSDFPPPE